MAYQFGPRVRILEQQEAIPLPDDLVHQSGFTGLDPWMCFIRDQYGFPLYRIVSEEGSRLAGWLALVHVKHPLFGNYLATSPFGSYGGFACASASSRDAILEKARALGRKLGAAYVNVRFDAGQEIPPDGWTQHPVYCTYLVDLTSDPDKLLRAYSSDHRNHIRKSLKKRFTVRFGHLDLLEDAYEGLSRSMHELGSPYHRKSYLAAMVNTLQESLEFIALYDSDGAVAGAGVFISQGDRVTNLHANILRRFRPEYAGEFLYWSVIERYCQKGFKELDLGRSLIGSGNEVFKLKWRPRRQPLAYWYALMPGQFLPELNQKNPKFQFAIQLWKRLPDFVVRAAGPYLIRGLA